METQTPHPLPELTMLAATLQQLAADRPRFAKVISEATGIDDSAIYRWIAGAAEPGFRNVRLMFAHCGDPDVQRALLAVFCSGTPWLYTRSSAEDLDGNGDGRISLDDALDSAITASGLVAEHMRGLRAAQGDGRVSDAERASLHGELDLAIGEFAHAKAVIDHVHARAQRRHRLGNGSGRGGRR